MSKAMKSKRNERKRNDLGSLIRSEFSLIIGAVTAAIFLWFGSRLVENLEHPAATGVIFIWLFVAVLWSAISVVRHADCLAIKCGEPYGTLILTLSAITIEVMMISAAMLHGKNNPTLARDMMFAVIMIALNGLIGLSLVLGGLRHAASLWRRDCRRPGASTGSLERYQCREKKPAAKVGQHSARIGACIHRPDHSGGSNHWNHLEANGDSRH